MSAMHRVLAFDLGASSGRAMLGSFDGDRISIEEIHRFSNDPVLVNGTLYWDIWRLFHEIKQGISKALSIGEFESIGIDTWGVDFGLIRDDGSLVEPPVHYWDQRTKGLVEKAVRKINRKDLYDISGIQLMELNTVYQLWSLARSRPHILGEAGTMLLMPDLFNYFLTGVRKTEYSIATTTQLLDARTGDWSARVLSAFGIPRRILTEIVPSGTVVGNLLPEICDELGCPAVKVIAVTGHDTQSAAVSVPCLSDGFIFISCGIWSLFGTELDAPIIDAKSARFNVTNEGGFGGRITFLKNIIGLWLVQECRVQWKREGKEYSFSELAEMAAGAPAMKHFIDPDDPVFGRPGNIPRRIQDYCRRTDQSVPSTAGELMRCVYQSLALKFRRALEEIESCTGKRYPSIHIVGGGVQDSFLCQLTSDACQRPVVAGPVEATVTGNIAVQMISLGAISGIAEARRIIANSNPLAFYEPVGADIWAEALARFVSVCSLH